MYDLLELKPVMNGKLRLQDNSLVCSLDGDEYEVYDLPIELKTCQSILNLFDGETSVKKVMESFSNISTEDIKAVIEAFYQSGLLNKKPAPEFVSGLEAILELEDLQNKLMYETLYRNVFWLKCQEPNSVPKNVFHGMAIENYHFLFRESWFDSPILGLPSNIEARVLMNEFFCEEYGHDELILRSLKSIGITREQIYKTVPLPETLSLCNALAYWAATDPLFFFSTMGVLEGKDLKIDSYVSAMEYSSVIEDSFVKHIRDHSNINLNDGHGNLSREIFRKIPAISCLDVERMKRQTYLFIEIYDRFYTAIWEYYSSTDRLLRLVD